MAAISASNQEVMTKFAQLYIEMFSHDGYADMRVEMRILRKGQKEVIIHCGRQYRYVVDFKNDAEERTPMHTANADV